MAAKRVYKKIAKGKGKVPVKVIRKKKGLKKKDPDKMHKRRMDAIKKGSAGMGENVQRATRVTQTTKTQPKRKRGMTQKEQLAILERDQKARAKKK